MSTVCFYNGYIYDSELALFERGSILCERGKIIAKSANSTFLTNADVKIDLKNKYLIPGFTDAHTHGRAGFDFNTASEDEMAVMLDSYKRSGVTSLFPTLASAPFDSLLEQGRRINRMKSHIGSSHAVGVHLEGRYLNPEKKGAHNPLLLSEPDANDVPALVENMAMPLHVSAAYELDKGERFINALKNAGATVGLAHTSADYKTTKHLYERYGISLTHMFNAMPPLHHRGGGPVCAGLTENMFTEIICDGIHVSPEAVRLAYKCKGSDRLVLITDSMEATDCPDGEYSIAGLPVIVKDSIARTLDDALAGSTLSLLSAINNLVSFSDADIPDAIRCATANPCKMLGIYRDYGSIDVGKNADLIVADINDNKLEINNVYVSCGL